MLARLQTYCDCLDDEMDCLTAESLRAAVRRFKFFPTVAELVEFCGEWRAERRASGPVHRTGGLTPALRNTYARMAMRDWRPPPGLGFWGEKHWEAWALAFALDRVDDGRIQGRHEFRDGRLCVTLDLVVDPPHPSDALVEEWRQARGHA